MCYLVISQAKTASFATARTNNPIDSTVAISGEGTADVLCHRRSTRGAVVATPVGADRCSSGGSFV